MKPAKLKFVNFFQVFEMDILESAAEVKQKYYRLAAKFHPDKNEAGANKFVVINDAKETILDNKKRAKYTFENIENFGLSYGIVTENLDSQYKTNVFIYHLEPEITGLGNAASPMINKKYYQIKIPKYNFFVTLSRNQEKLNLLNDLIKAVNE